MMQKFLVLMIGVVCVISACGGADTKEAVPSDPLAAEGKQLAAVSCAGCHTTNGASSAGPTWKGLAGSEVSLADGRKVVADEAYLTRSIEDPDAELVAGYPKTMALSVPKGSISAEDAKALVAYIQSLVQ